MCPQSPKEALAAGPLTNGVETLGGSETPRGVGGVSDRWLSENPAARALGVLGLNPGRAHARAGFLHVWRGPEFPTSYFLFPLSLSAAASAPCAPAGWPNPQGCKGGEQSFRNPQRHFTENKYNRGGGSSVAEEVTPCVGFPQSLPAADGARSAPPSLCPGVGPGRGPQTLQLTLLKALFTCSTASLLFSQGRKRCCGGKEKV